MSKFGASTEVQEDTGSKFGASTLSTEQVLGGGIQEPVKPVQQQTSVGEDIVAGGAEFAAGINRGVLGAADFFTTDQVNAILQLSGSDKRIPSLSEIGQEFGAPPAETFLPGQTGRALGAAGEVIPAAAGVGAFLRKGAQQLPALAEASESAIRGVGRQLGQTTAAADIGFAGVSGAGAQVGQEVGGETGALIGGVLAPLGAGGLRNIAGAGKRFAQSEIAAGEKQLLESAEKAGVDILTTDISPPDTFLGKAVQRLSEKLGPFGSGSKRQAQQKARENIVKGIKEEFDIELDSPFADEIVKSLNVKSARKMEQAFIKRDQAVTELDTFGQIPVNKTITAIDNQLAKQAGLGAKRDSALIKNLQDTKSSIVNKSFSGLKNQRSVIIDDLLAVNRSEDIRSAGALQNVKSAIDKDMAIFANQNNVQAGKDWRAANRSIASELQVTKGTELKRILDAGEATPEKVLPLLKGGKISELKRLESSLGTKGKSAARAAILQDALKESGFFSGSANPDRFATAMLKPNRQNAFNVFFKAGDKKQIEGMTRVLDATRRAQQAAQEGLTTGASIQPFLVGGGLTAGATSNPIATIAVGGSLSAIAKGYESKVFRTLLLKLANTQKGSLQETSLLDTVVPSVIAVLQAKQREQDKQTQ